ncbi:MAG: hypothetical protein ABIS21_03120 [Acidimicrobiales bacterium]
MVVDSVGRSGMALVVGTGGGAVVVVVVVPNGICAWAAKGPRTVRAAAKATKEETMVAMRGLGMREKRQISPPWCPNPPACATPI